MFPVMSDSRALRHDPATSASGPVLSEHGFWWAFSLGWLALTGLLVSSAATGEQDLGTALIRAPLAVAPLAGLAFIVALRRRDLLRPEWTLSRTVAVHAAVGVLYALGAAALAGVLTWVTGVDMDEPGLSESPAAVFILRALSGLFVYSILAGFLMWTESLARVHESRTLAAREAMLRAEAEAKALRAQFNPHFVFNTLHSLMLLVRAEPETAERAIEDVAALIRYASVLQRSGVDEVRLESELEIARRYVALEKLRLEDRLRVEWSLAPGIGGYAIPAFSLQSLMENAIKHGISPKPEGGTVRVSAELVEGSLVMVVEDDGQGAQSGVVAGAEGRGIDLLTRRLAALHGDDASLEYDAPAGGGFRVTLRVPAKVGAPGPFPDGHGRDIASQAREAPHDPIPTAQRP